MRRLVSVSIERRLEWLSGGVRLLGDYAPALRATDYKNPHIVWEIKDDEDEEVDMGQKRADTAYERRDGLHANG